MTVMKSKDTAILRKLQQGIALTPSEKRQILSRSAMVREGNTGQKGYEGGEPSQGVKDALGGPVAEFATDTAFGLMSGALGTGRTGAGIADDMEDGKQASEIGANALGNLAKDVIGYATKSSPVSGLLNVGAQYAMDVAKDKPSAGYNAITGTFGALGGILGSSVGVLGTIGGSMAGSKLGQWAADLLGFSRERVQSTDPAGYASIAASLTPRSDPAGYADIAGSIDSISNPGSRGYSSISNPGSTGYSSISNPGSHKSLGSMAAGGFDNDSSGGIGEAEGSSDARGDHGGGGWI